MGIEPFLAHTHGKAFVYHSMLSLKSQRSGNTFNSVYLEETTSELDLVLFEIYLLSLI